MFKLEKNDVPSDTLREVITQLDFIGHTVLMQSACMGGSAKHMPAFLPSPKNMEGMAWLILNCAEVLDVLYGRFEGGSHDGIL